MRRWKIRTIIFISLMTSGAANAGTFASKPHGVSFETPAGTSIVDDGSDDRIVRLNKKDVGLIYVRHVNGQREKIEKIAKNRFASLPSGVSLGNFFDSTIGGKKVSSAAFEFPSKTIKGTVFYTAAPDGLVEFFCAAEEIKYLEIFFDCAGLIENLKFTKREGQRRNENAKDDPLLLARSYLEGGDAQLAKNWLSKAEVFSVPAIAMRIWIARFEGDLDSIESQIFENGLDLSGAYGAIAWHQAALGILQMDPKEAEKRILFAIESDRSYIPAYVSLARLKLAKGKDAGSVVNEVNKLLDRAPQNEEILKLKEKLAGIAYKTERFIAEQYSN